MNQILDDASEIEIVAYNGLKTVIDPELDVNIIDLGLVYKIFYDEAKGLLVEMTLSSKNCPMGDIILTDVKSKLQEILPKINHEINLVWEPAWTIKYITPKGLEQLAY